MVIKNSDYISFRKKWNTELQFTLVSKLVGEGDWGVGRKQFVLSF